MLTPSKLYRNLKGFFEDVGVEPAGFEAGCMLEAVFGQRLDRLKQDDTTECTEEQLTRIEEMSTRRIIGYPLQYLVGDWEFYGLPFYVGEGVLIPRQDTETIVDTALEEIRRRDPQVIFDLCTGSGCIAVAIAKKSGKAVTAIELSETAAEFARRNIERNEADVTLIVGDALSEDTYKDLPMADMIVCNPPYLSLPDMEDLQTEVSYEPSMALYGGEDGLDFYRRLIPLYQKRLSPNGIIILEVGAGQADACCEMLRTAGFRNIRAINDMADIPRAVEAEL